MLPLSASSQELIRYCNLKLMALGQPASLATADAHLLEIAGPLFRRQAAAATGEPLCPADARIQAFLDDYLHDVCPDGAPRLPARTFVLNRPGLAETLSLPPDRDSFVSPWLNSYRVPQGLLHNPRSDRRTTQGIFHVVEGGAPIPADKLAVPKQTFAALLAAAFRPLESTLALPFTADQPDHAGLFVSLLLRPLVCPATAHTPAKSLETRFFAPGSLVSNLDFVERIFGNAGDPYRPENDAALDVMHWTGHTGCVILAPDLVGITKRAVGLPHYDEATERQRQDGMCWRDEHEIYNEGRAFKVACRDYRGVMVTIIADNYYGYCKKEVKTQISFAANLYGLAEEEHAGGAIANPAYLLGQEFHGDRDRERQDRTFADTIRLLGGAVEVQPAGYAVDRRFPTVLYLPEYSHFDVLQGDVTWQHEGTTQRLRLDPTQVYVLPSGFRLQLEKQPGGSRWRLTGTSAQGTLCHKPCTVSGGGKSEISKSIANAIISGPIIVRDYQSDMDLVERILKADFSRIRPVPLERDKRPILSPERSLGSVIKLLTPSPDYSEEYNAWLGKLPPTIRQLVCTVKRYYRPEWGDNWRQHFTVDRVNGELGNTLKLESEPLVGSYLRVGRDPDGAWRIHKLRPDFHAAAKVQREDDITASIVVPAHSLPGLNGDAHHPSVKLVENTEAMLFQRPDDAVYRGFDKQAELDLATPGTFLSNFEPLSYEAAQQIVSHVVEFDRFTAPMQKLLCDYVEQHPTEQVVSSAHSRIVDGKPSKNPRYLQRRPDRTDPRGTWLAEVGTRLRRGIPIGEPVFFPVDAVIAGRRGNPPDPQIGLPPLAIYSPIHYQELPELFMDYIASLTGKSPSTTGFGSEGALTKRPFNALLPVIDVNNALVGSILTGYAGFTSAAGHIGPLYKVEHDVSMIVPELWCRMTPQERDPAFLLANGYLEPLTDFEHDGRTVLASRLGYRITAKFADRFLGRIFETPHNVFPDVLLRPELQDLSAFASGVDAVVESQARVAREYFDDGSVALACPPLKALLHIMVEGHYEGRGSNDPSIRALFTRESLLASDWYRERLATQQQIAIRLWQRHVATLEQAGTQADLLAQARQQLAHVKSPDYLEELQGTIGADPSVMH